MESEWTNATMHKAGIKYTPDAVFEWAEYVERLAEKLNKSERDKRVKYLAGFPPSFDVLIVSERHVGTIGSYTHPVNHPAHHPAAGTPHPHAGQPDIIATAHGFYPEWERMIRLGQIRSVPQGMASRIDDEQDEDELDERACKIEAARMARERITQHTICLICGGAGHAGYVDGIGQCLSARLDHKVPPEDLEQFRYPPGYRSSPRFRFSRSNRRPPTSNSRSSPISNPRPRPTSQAREIEPTEEALEADYYASMSRLPRAQFRTQTQPPPRPRPRTRSTTFNERTARQIEEENEQTDDAPQNVNRAADDENDNDEPLGLRVDFDEIVYS